MFRLLQRQFTKASTTSREPAPCNRPARRAAGSPTRTPGRPFGGATWQVTYTGNSGFLNTVDAELYRAGARKIIGIPTDKLNVDIGLRDEELRIQSRQHFQQRSELLVPSRAARVLLQPADAVAVLHSTRLRRADGRRFRSSASTARSIIRFRRIRCRPSTPTVKTDTCC